MKSRYEHGRSETMATLVRWQPWTELPTLQTEMSRLMNGLMEGNGKSVQSWVPAVDVWETESEIVYAFDLPGIPEEQISVEVEDGSLTVTAERQRTNELSDDRFYRFERRHGTFTRTIGLPQGVSEDGIAAEYTSGRSASSIPGPWSRTTTAPRETRTSTVAPCGLHFSALPRTFAIARASRSGSPRTEHGSEVSSKRTPPACLRMRSTSTYTSSS